MGGGRQEFLPTTVEDVEGNPGKRTDGHNLIKEWQHKHRKHNAQYIQSKAELLNVSPIIERFGFSARSFFLVFDGSI